MLEFATSTERSKYLSRQFKDKKLRRIYHGIYSNDFESPVEQLVQKNWMEIVLFIVTKGILSHRTAVDLKPFPFENQSIVFITSSYTKTINLPGLIIKIYQGDNQHFIEPVIPHLTRSNMPRFLLENLSRVSSHYKNIKTVGSEGVEFLLAKELRLRGENRIHQIRDDARIIAEKLDWLKEYTKLSKIISALLGTHSIHRVLSSPYAKAIARKEPYDYERIRLFDKLALFLKQCNFIQRKYPYTSTSFKNLSFYESYFSNYIEGTEFMIDEAEDIVFKGLKISHRHADSHDVLANFSLTNDYTEMSITPHSVEQLIDLLQNRHALLMRERPEKRPGEFKLKSNKAGNTYFVTPEETLGTLCQGFERYKLLEPGLEKALFMQFLISEVHPFDDGNGRLSRIMMNSELVANENFKIIVPTVCRENYLSGLRLATRDLNFRTYVKFMDQAQAYTASINWLDYGDAREKIELDNAHLTPDEGIPTFNRVFRHLKISHIPPVY